MNGDDLCALSWCHRKRVHPIHDREDTETKCIGDYHTFVEPKDLVQALADNGICDVAKDAIRELHPGIDI